MSFKSVCLIVLLKIYYFLDDFLSTFPSIFKREVVTVSTIIVDFSISPSSSICLCFMYLEALLLTT